MAFSQVIWDKIRKNLKHNDKLNEADTKGKLVDPILTELGWDLMGDEVLRELPVNIGTGTTYADYVLKIDGAMKVLVEVKSLGSELDEKRARQALSYGTLLGVRWCVLTNGRKYQIFSAKWGGSSPQESLFRQFELDPDGSAPDDFELLSKVSIRNGKLDSLAQESNFDRRLRLHLGEILGDLREKVLVEARNRVYSRIKPEVPGATRDSVRKAIEPMLKIEIFSEASPSAQPRVRTHKTAEENVQHWLTPVRDEEPETAEECIRSLVLRNGIYAFGENTPGRKKIRAGDLICFFAAGKGVVAYATVASSPEKMMHPAVRHSEKYQWVFRVTDPVLFLDKPRRITAELRAQMDAFKGKSPTGPWAWFVQATSRVTEHDFKLLIGA